MRANSKSLREKLEEFDKHSHTLKLYSAFRWGEDLPCPTRLMVNPYKSCTYKCAFCYVWANYGSARQKENFRESLMHDIERAQKLSLDGTITMVSSSTDPFQPIEKTVRDSHFAIKQLLANNFPVLIMTRNPGMLLEQEYVELTKNPKLFVDVSIASLHENSLAPPINERLTAIKSLSAMGKLVRVKVDPIVPIVDGVKYQTEKELNEIVRLSKEAGSQMIIAKTMRLNDDVPEGIRHVLADYYQKSGSRSGINLVLSVEARKRLITPVINACTEYGIPFCPCVDLDSLSDERTVCCIVIGEQKTPITEVMKG